VVYDFTTKGMPYISRTVVYLHISVCIFGKIAKPGEMSRPLALTGITLHTKTLHEMTKQKKSVTEH